MKAAESKVRCESQVENLAFCLITSMFLLGFCGCSVVSYFQPDKYPRERLSASYDQTKLKTTSTLDALGKIQTLEDELLSQSDTIVASSGQSNNGYKSWFTMVAFDEHKMTAQRKYFFLVDERAKVSPTKIKRFLIGPKRGLVFDSQMILQEAVLDKPYATEEARQIAVLQQVVENLCMDIGELSGDTGELGQGNEMLTVSGMLINQAFEAVLLELGKSPVLAKRLSDARGVEFNHISLDKGQIRVIVEGDIVTVRIGLGLFRY